MLGLGTRLQILQNKMVQDVYKRQAFYYGSLEFKGMSEAIRGSRSCGVLLSGDTALVVYNTMDRNMKWAKKMECSMRTWTERML